MSQISDEATGGAGGIGDVVGPASAVDSNFASFDGTTGKLIKDSGSAPGDFQPIDATLTSIAALGTAADKIAYTTGIDIWAETDISAFGRSLIDDSTAAAARSTLGVALDYISTGTASSGDVEMVIPATYNRFLFVIDNVSTSAAGGNLEMVISDDAGSTYKTTGYASGMNYNAWNTATLTNVSPGDAFQLIFRQSGDYFQAIGWFTNGDGTNQNPSMITQASAYNSFNYGGGSYTAAPLVVDKVKFQSATGTLNTGTFTLFGIKSS